MLNKLREVIPQHLKLIHNLIAPSNFKTRCKIITNGTGVINDDIIIFRIVARFIADTKRFDFKHND